MNERGGIWIRMERAKERHVEIVMLRTRLIIADPVKQLCKVIGRFTAIGAWNRARSILFPLSSTTANRRSRYRLQRYERANGVYRDFFWHTGSLHFIGQLWLNINGTRRISKFSFKFKTRISKWNNLDGVNTLFEGKRRGKRKKTFRKVCEKRKLCESEKKW